MTPGPKKLEELERADHYQREAIQSVSDLHLSLAEEVRRASDLVGGVNARLDRLEAGASRGGKWFLLVWLVTQLLGSCERNLWRVTPPRAPAPKEAPAR